MNKTILIKPVISEQSLSDAQKGVYTFKADITFTKPQIKKEIEEMFKVHVVRIATSIMKGKKRQAGKKRLVVYKPDFKKARVKLKEKEKIDLFEVGTAV